MPRRIGEPSAASASVALANPGGRGLRATLGFVSSGERSFRGPRGRRIRGAIEHTAPLPRGSSGGPLVDPDGNLLGINSLRLDGGLILAVPAGAAVKERILGARARRGAARRTGSAWRSRRRGWRGACGTRSGCPERDGLLVRAVRGRQPGARRPASSAGDLIVAAGGSATGTSRRSTPRSTRCPATGGELELTRRARHRRAHRHGDASRGARPRDGGRRATVPAETEALDAYSRAVMAVAERLAPSVASLRVMRRTRGGQVPAGAGQRRGAHARRLPAHVRPRRGPLGLPRSRHVRRRPRGALRGGGPRPALGPRAAARRGRAASPPPSSATPSACGSASSSSPSATRTASAARSRPASSPRSAARCRRARGAPAGSSTT